MENLTIESLARAIHEVTLQAVFNVYGERATKFENGAVSEWEDYDDLSDGSLAIRREQARLMLARIMR